MTTPPRLLVVGSYAAALVMETDHLPAPGETLLGRNFRTVHGGKGSNQAVQAARLGAATTFAVSVGADAHGDALVALLEDEGVSTAGVLRHPAAPTGVGFIIVDRQGANLITVDLGANGALTPAELEARPALFAGAAVVVAQLEIPLDTALAAMRLGRAAGAVTVLNPAPAADLRDRDLSSIDFLVPNESEARACAGAAPDAPLPPAMEHLRALGARHVITTTGAEGCLWLDPAGRLTAVPGFRVEPVDTVGAGDAFTAALAVALAERCAVPDALRFAHAAAALSVTRPDTIPSYHDRAAVEAFLRRA